ncbi:hypothetical protein EGY05_15680 [Chryseobacterium arthrosphaerae]|uniref:hypothetical protein n=1 Tax=Chryseobacterium arthrosphaerae TaxID=651561 RepID=UPI000F4FD886|nr:hypothetical protein [Chryseobacterium arthrosphaerae]AYZ13286.1 hypothetical protein EGY05_15680 [Chryseobacterium arthrosphaerae]
MKQLKYILIPAICVGMASCSPKEKKNDSPTVTETKSAAAISDLASLGMGENINDILKSGGWAVKDTVQTDDITLMGNERLAFASGKLLKYDGTSLEGKNDYNTNKVIFHYGKVEKEFGPIANEKNEELGMYQLNIYSEPQAKALLENLKKTLQKPVFTTVHESFDSEVKGNTIIPTQNKFIQEVAIWKVRDLVYYYCETKIENKPEEYRCNMFVFKNREWVNLLQGSGYPDLNKIP